MDFIPKCIIHLAPYWAVLCTTVLCSPSRLCTAPALPFSKLLLSPQAFYWERTQEWRAKGVCKSHTTLDDLKVVSKLADLVTGSRESINDRIDLSKAAPTWPSEVGRGHPPLLTGTVSRCPSLWLLVTWNVSLHCNRSKLGSVLFKFEITQVLSAMSF